MRACQACLSRCAFVYLTSEATEESRRDYEALPARGRRIDDYEALPVGGRRILCKREEETREWSWRLT